MSKGLSDDELAQVARWLSSERMATFLRIAGTERDAFELHQQMLAVGGAFMPVLGLIEIALRNAVSERLRGLFQTPDWLNNPPAPFVWRGEEQQSLSKATRQGQRAEYAKLTNAQKKALDAVAYPGGIPAAVDHEARARARQRAITITQGQQIAQLTILFWKRLFSGDYEATLWARSLKRIFPNKALNRADVARELEHIYQARNRIAHHEPLYGARLTNTLAAIDFIARNFETVKSDEDALLARIIAADRERLHSEAEKLAAMLARFTVPPA